LKSTELCLEINLKSTMVSLLKEKDYKKTLPPGLMTLGLYNAILLMPSACVVLLPLGWFWEAV